VLYVCLLWASRKALLSGKPSTLSRATAFLSTEYTTSASWWEPVEMCRKLTLTGWVLLIKEESEQARVLVALLVSITFLSLHLSIKPLRRSDDAALTALAHLTLILIYICTLLIKTCDVSEATCRTFGFGDTAEGVYLFCVFFGLAMVLLHLLVALVNLWITGLVPTILLVAQAHSMTPSTILIRVLARRARGAKRCIAHFLHLDVPHLTPWAAAAVYSFHGKRSLVRAWAFTADLPREVLPVAEGVSCSLLIDKVFPRTWCFVHADLAAFAVRWTRTQFISLHSIERVDLKMNTVKSPRISVQISIPSPRRSDVSERASARKPSSEPRKKFWSWAHGTPNSTIEVRFNDCGGISRVLKLQMSSKRGSEWVEGLRELLKLSRSPASPAYWRWVLSCMAATSKAGASGFLPKSQIMPMLRRANANPKTSTSELTHSLLTAAGVEKRADVPQWLQAAQSSSGRGAGVLNAPQAAHLLLQLSTTSSGITELFTRYKHGDLMGLEGWLNFVKHEQLSKASLTRESSKAGFARESSKAGFARLVSKHDSDRIHPPAVETELAEAQDCFERAVDNQSTELQNTAGLSMLHFHLQLLSPANDAVTPAQGPSNKNTWGAPLAHYWHACSHNTYVVGDQLTGRSTADMYRRQLLQGNRQVEIDCWPGSSSPIVTHGHTWCTAEKFEAVAEAISECAFVNSELPVILSLEMHCNTQQRNMLAKMLVENIGDRLLKFIEFGASSRMTLLSPVDLTRRVLVKGKAVARKKACDGEVKGKAVARKKARDGKESFSGQIVHTFSGSFRRSIINAGSTSSRRSSETNVARESVEARNSEHYEPSTMRSTEPTEVIANAMRTLERRETNKLRSRKTGNDDAELEIGSIYTSCLALRSLPIAKFLRDDPLGMLPITSINEDRLLKELGLAREERKLIEGLTTVNTRGSQGLTEEQLSSRAVVRLAADPPPGVGNLQRRTRTWLLRPFPLGLRFSGKNMSPLPCWLAGAHGACLNFSESDLAVQLHFALFHGFAGFVLKPSGMLGKSGEGGAEDTRASADKSDSGRSSHHPVKDDDPDVYWPLPREQLVVTTIKLIELHHLPKRGEQRPRFAGSRGACHDWLSELSGKATPPNNSESSSPSVKLALHPIGGFCGVSREFPPMLAMNTEISSSEVKRNGMNAAFAETVHCVAAEPSATILRICVICEECEMAFATAVLGRLRRGYRIFQLRGRLGTRIELCCLFVHISTSSEANWWSTPRELRYSRRISILSSGANVHLET